MQTTNKIDEILRLIVLESAKEADDEAASIEMSRILGQTELYEMRSESKLKMISELEDLAFNLSFGRLLSTEMELRNETLTTLADKSKLPETVIRQLLDDSIYTNNVPVLMFRDLLKALQISFDKAEQAIRNTFSRLKANVNADVFLSSGTLPVPAYRKGSFLSQASLSGTPRGNGKDLFENEQVMEKYLKRLKGLIAE